MQPTTDQDIDELRHNECRRVVCGADILRFTKLVRLTPSKFTNVGCPCLRHARTWVVAAESNWHFRNPNGSA